MNIFFLDRDPRKAAEYHCDKHVVKMILETAQLLSSAHRILDADVLDDEMNNRLYKLTHKNHPCAIWARESEANYHWLYKLMIELNTEFVKRYGHSEDHLTIRKLRLALALPPENIPSGITFADPPQCMPEEFQEDDAVYAYRNYYLGGKSDIATWDYSKKPEWWQV